MTTESWKDHEPAPIEFLHGRIIDLFHDWRKLQTESTTVEINGMQFNEIFVRAKKETYEKYAALDLKKAVLKSDLFRSEKPDAKPKESEQVESCTHPLEKRVDYHDSSVLCTQCDAVIEQFGKAIKQ